jgi:NADH-quinone oxidoreductase subunit L
MFMACGVGAFAIGIFHVMTHAFFKALMFLGAGSVIHGMHHEQDMRRMGGLKKYMPITYLTFLAGWLAICGIIPFSGFWSKDEILWNAAATRHIPVGWIVWIVGVIAATCTAFYMTRLMAMTFWGKEKFLEPPAGGEADEAHASAFDKGLAKHDAKLKSAGDRPRHEPGEHVGQVDHHHVHIPHESPRSMWVPLAVLAVLATVGGFVGISTAFTGGKHVGGRMNIVNFLDPIIWNPTTRYFGTHELVDSYGKPLPSVAETHAVLVVGEHEPVETPPPYGSEGFNLAHAVESKVHSETLSEWVFILISLLVAGIGIGLGFLFYVKDTSLPDIWAARLRPLYQASYNKYWVDEFYGWAVTRRVMDAARGVFAFDSKVVDGAVNGSAWLTRFSSRVTGLTDQYFVDGIVNAVAAFVMRLMSPLFRAAQTGFTQNYAFVMVLGLVAALGVIFGADIVGWFKR